MSPREEAVRGVRVWDLPLRLFHWTLVLASAVAFLSSEEDSPLNQWHVLAGWVAGLLIVFRLVWGFVGGEHSRFSNFVRPGQVLDHLSRLFRGRTEPSLGHNPLGAVAVILMLALAAIAVGTGAFGGERTEDLHELVAWTLLAVIGLHLAAVLIMSLLQRESLVRSMVTGSKPRERHPRARDAKPPRAAGVLLAALAVAATTYGILRFDPKAFTLRPAEGVEQAASPASQSDRGGEQGED